MRFSARQQESHVDIGQLPVFLEKVARCEIRGGCMHFIWDELDIAIPISTCISNMRACQRALDEWERQSADVIALPRH